MIVTEETQSAEVLANSWRRGSLILGLVQESGVIDTICTIDEINIDYVI